MYIVLPYIKNINSALLGLSTSDLLSFIISNTDKHEISCIWKWISCSNDVMNHVDCVIKRDVYPLKMHLCSKYSSGLSVFVLKISVVYHKKYIMDDIAWIFALFKDKESFVSLHQSATKKSVATVRRRSACSDVIQNAETLYNRNLF